MTPPVHIPERDLVDAIIDTARTLGWRVAHFRPARTKHGWRTPVQGDGKGFPDLILVHPEQARMIVAEVKTGRNTTTPEQDAWLDAIRAVATASVRWHLNTASNCDPLEVYEWRDTDWKAGRVEHDLRPHPHRNAA